MSYASLISGDALKSQIISVIKPRYALSTWTAAGFGTAYYTSFTLGNVIDVKVDGVTLTEVTANPVANNEWFYDPDTNRVYLEIGAAPTTEIIVATYEIFLGTYDAHWYRVPTDNTTRQVYYEPLITKSPSTNQTTSDGVFGFMPTQSSSISISNATKFLQEHLYASSFSDCDVDLWHWLDELTTSNVNKFFSGICGAVNATDKTIEISVYSRNKLFEKEYRNSVGTSFYATSAFPSLDQKYQARPIRDVYGVVESFIPVNIDYNSSAPTTSNNRTWVCIQAVSSDLASGSETVPAAPTSTTTRTYLNAVGITAAGFNIGDTVWIDSSGGVGDDRHATVTAIGSDYIDHTTTTLAAATASVVKRSFIGNIKILKDGVLYTTMFNRDWIEYVDATNKVVGFTFNASMEANNSMTTITPLDLVYCRVYGRKNSTTMGGPAFGANYTPTQSLTQGVVILWELLKRATGSESGLDAASFTSLQATKADNVGFAVPQSDAADFPTYRNLISQLTQTLLVSIYSNSSLKWAVSEVKPITTTTKTIQDDEIAIGSFEGSYRYDDVISDVVVQYRKSEVNSRSEISSDSFLRVSATSNYAKLLHNIYKQKTFTSLHFLLAEANTFATRLSYMLGDRQNTTSFSTTKRFIDSNIGDNITASRTRITGYEFDVDVERTRDFSVTSTSKSLNNITIEMTDQKGIQDNEASW